MQFHKHGLPFLLFNCPTQKLVLLHSSKQILIIKWHSPSLNLLIVLRLNSLSTQSVTFPTVTALSEQWSFGNLWKLHCITLGNKDTLSFTTQYAEEKVSNVCVCVRVLGEQGLKDSGNEYVMFGLIYNKVIFISFSKYMSISISCSSTNSPLPLMPPYRTLLYTEIRLTNVASKSSQTVVSIKSQISLLMLITKCKIFLYLICVCGTH